MGVAKWKATSDFRELERDFAKLQKENAKLIQSNQKLANQSKKAQQAAQNAMGKQRQMAAQGKRGIDRQADAVKNMAASYLGVNAALQAVIQSLKTKDEIESRSLNRNISVAASQAEVRTNLGDVTTEEFNAFLDDLRKIKGDAKFGDIKQVNLAASSILSAVGGSQETTKEILRAVTPLFRTKPDQLAEFGGALGDVMTAGSFKSGKEAAAFMVALQSQGRFTELSAFSKVAPALATAKATSPEDPRKAVREAGALFAAIGRTAGDKDAAVTKTAVANLLSNLQTVLPDVKGAFARLEAVRQDPELQKEVLKSGFKGEIKAVIKDLVKGQGDVSKALKETAPKIRGSIPAFDRLAKDLRSGTPSLALSTAKKGAEGVVGDVEEGATLGSRRALARDFAKKSREIISESQFFRNFLQAGPESFMLGMSTEPLEEARTSIQQRRALIQTRLGEKRVGFDTVKPLEELAPETRKQVIALTRLLEQIETLQQQLGQNTGEEARKTNQLLERLIQEQQKLGTKQDNVNKGNAAAVRGSHLEN